MNRQLLDYYLCDVYINDKVYTGTRCERISQSVEDSQLGDDLYDLRSKKLVNIAGCDSIVPRCTSLSHNPYIDDTTRDTYNQVISESIEAVLIYKQLGNQFTNTQPHGDEVDKFSFFLQILDICPYFNRGLFEVILSDSGTAENFLRNNFDIIQTISVVPVHYELGITVEELINTPADELVCMCRALWCRKLIEERNRLVSQLQADIDTSTGDGVGSEAFYTNSEIRKQIIAYNDIDIVDNINSLRFIGDVYRYYPFNDNDEGYTNFIQSFSILKELKLRPVNRWHHRHLVIYNKVADTDVVMTYWDIENNTKTVMRIIVDIKKNSILFAQREILSILEAEIVSLESTTQDDVTSIALGNIKEVRDMVMSIEADFTASTIPEAIDYWPPILGTIPEMYTDTKQLCLSR